MAYYNPLTLRYEQGEPISSNQSPSATDAFTFTPPGMTTGMGMPGVWGGNQIDNSHNPWQSDFTPPAQGGSSGSWQDAAAYRDPNAPAPYVPPQPGQSAPTSAQVQANPGQYAGTSWGAALLPDSPGNIAAQRIAFMRQPGQASDFMSQGSQPAGRPGQVWDPVSQSYRGANDPPAGAVRTNNPNVWVLPNGSTWNTPGYSNDVTTDQGYDQFRQQTFGVGNPIGAGIYQNTNGAGAGPTNLGGPGIPYSPNASPAQQALMATQPVQVTNAPPPQTRTNTSYQGPAGVSGNFGASQFGQYNGSGYPLTPGMPGYVYQNQQPQQAPPPQQQQQLPSDFLSFLASIFGNGQGQGQQYVDPYNPYGGQQQGGFTSNVTQGNQPGGNQYVPTSAWDNFGAQGGWGNPGQDRSRSNSGWVDNAATLNPGQQNSGATTGGSNGSLASQFSQPATDTNQWSGINQLPSLGRSGGLWG